MTPEATRLAAFLRDVILLPTIDTAMRREALALLMGDTTEQSCYVRVNGSLVSVSPEELKAITGLQKIYAIKKLREIRPGMGLGELNDLCEALAEAGALDASTLKIGRAFLEPSCTH